MDIEVLKAIEGMVRAVAPPLMSIGGVWLGWRLGVHSQWKQRRFDNLQNRLAAHREVIYLAANVPPESSIADLKAKFAADPKFCEALSLRLVRLFGLRGELTPYLDPEIRRFADNTFRPLFSIGVGLYELLPEKVDEFASAAIELRRLANTVEEKLIREHEELAG